MVRLIEIVFGVVLGASLTIYRSVIADFFAPSHLTAVVALVTIYVTAVLSWLDWHDTIDRAPYALQTFCEKVRLAVDLLVPGSYVYVLFAIDAFSEEPRGSVARFLAGYTMVFALYVVSGLLRRRQYGVRASRVGTLLAFTAYFVVLLAIYLATQHAALGAYAVVVNVAFVLLAFAGVISHRVLHAHGGMAA